MKITTVDVEKFSRNLARLVEEGGRALAAYLKPREQGRNTNEFAEEVTEVIKTLGRVAEYWLADPQRSIELQTRLGKAYLDLWASAVERLAGEETAPVATPAARQALHRSRVDVEQVLRFAQAGLSA
jgi:polyhydroxyalkanoate synthase subunit PhaC